MRSNGKGEREGRGWTEAREMDREAGVMEEVKCVGSEGEGEVRAVRCPLQGE